MGNTNPGGTTKTPITAQAKDVTRPALRMRTSTFHREIGRRGTLTTRSRLSVGNGQHRLCRRDAFESYLRNCSPRDARDSKRQSVRCTEATVYCRDACLQCGAVSPTPPPAKTASGRPAQQTVPPPEQEFSCSGCAPSTDANGLDLQDREYHHASRHRLAGWNGSATRVSTDAQSVWTEHPTVAPLSPHQTPGPKEMGSNNLWIGNGAVLPRSLSDLASCWRSYCNMDVDRLSDRVRDLLYEHWRPSTDIQHSARKTNSRSTAGTLDAGR